MAAFRQNRGVYFTFYGQTAVLLLLIGLPSANALPFMHQFFTENPTQLANFKLLLATPKHIVITMHQNPDGDAMGSALGLAAVLQPLGHRVQVVSPTDYPDFLRWMPNQDLVLSFEGQQQAAAEAAIAAAEVIFFLDFSAANRLKAAATAFEAATATKILIDHHEQPSLAADYIFWNEKAAATCQLVYELVEQTFGSEAITPDAAACLYAGLVTDTGSFRFHSTTPAVHRIAAELLKKDIRHDLVHRQLFDTNSFDRLRFLGYALGEKLVHLPEYRVAYFSFSKEELARFNSQNGDTEGVVNYGLSIKGVVLSAIFIERDEAIRISFRSVDGFSASELARNHFNGGGHFNAAGGRSEESLLATVNKFLHLLPEYAPLLLSQPQR